MRSIRQHRERELNRGNSTATIAVFPRPVQSRPAKRVLVVSSHFPPERAAGVHRILRTIRQLRDSAWPVTVLTVDPQYYRAGTPIDEALLNRLPEGVDVYRAKVLRGLTIVARWRRQFRESVQNSLSRVFARGRNRLSVRNLSPVPSKAPSAKRPYVDSEIGWFLPAIREGARVIGRHKPDLIFSSAPPFTCHLVAAWLAWRHQITWVADFRDPWARSPWKRADLRDSWKLRLREWLERLVIERADAVILNTPLLTDEFAAYYGPALARKFHTVTNGYDAEHLMPFLRPVLRRSSRLVLTHAGSLYRQRDPRPLVQAVASAIAKGRIAADGIELHFVGTVSPEFRLADTIREFDLGSTVRLTPPVPHERCLQYLLESDVLIVIQPGTRLQVPVKLYEYLPFRKPILALAPSGALTMIAEESGLGVVVPPDDVAAIEDAICQLYEHRDGLDDRFRPDSMYIDRFDGRAVSRQLQTIFEGL
ncbi:MAG: glycosyltransferase [Acidobacteria bacterium]|nr:MAG: glycosyltransferase [Acidobacteriota bacterium]